MKTLPPMWKNAFTLPISLALLVSNQTLFAQSGVWTTKAPMPEARASTDGHAAVLQDRYLIFIGGSTSDGVTHTAPEIYDALTDNWSFGAPASVPRTETANEVLDNKVYVAGGWVNSDSGASTGALEIYDPVADTWSGGASMALARGATASAAIAGKLYVAGGMAGGTQFADLEIYNPATDSWTTGAPMPTRTQQPGSAAFGGKLYVFGGGNSTDLILNKVQIYDPLTDAWTFGTPMPHGRSEPNVGVINGKIIVAGGYDAVLLDSESDVQIYDPLTDTWSMGASMPAVLAETESAVVNSQLFVAGGLVAPGYWSVPLNATLFVFNPNSAPIARCKDVLLFADTGCAASGSIDDGSYDPDPGDTLTLTQSPAGPYPLGSTVVLLTATDNHGASASCAATVRVVDTAAPAIVCPQNVFAPCGLDKSIPVTFNVTASDNCDPSPTVSSFPPSGSGFPIGVTTVNCVAADRSGNQAVCSFTVTRPPLGFTGFLSPLTGADSTGGSYNSPLRNFKLGSTVPFKFTASCNGTPVSTGIHTLQISKYSTTTDGDPAIDATPVDGATAGNAFRYSSTDGQWHFNLDTKNLSAGTWLAIVALSDGSTHNVWFGLKK